MAFSTTYSTKKEHMAMGKRIGIPNPYINVMYVMVRIDEYL